jgi:hypothetical protein
MRLLLSQMVPLWQIHVFHQLSWTGLFGTKKAYLHLEKPKLHELSPSKTNSILPGKQCARCSYFSHQWFSFKRYKYFFNSAQYACLEQIEPISTLKHLSFWKYFLKNLAILTGKQSARCSGFYHRWFSFEKYMCFFNLAQMPICSKWAFLHLKLWFAGSIPVQTQLSKVNDLLDCSAYDTDGFLSRDKCVSST